MRRRARIAYVDGHRLRRSLLAAATYVASQRRELNRINVFPVPDGDTGTNLALTLRSVADAVRPLRSGSVSEVAGVAAEASVLGARGNSGMLFSHFLLGFSRSLGCRIRAGTAEIAEALASASLSLQDVLECPQEGTIITVARDVATAARKRAAIRHDLYEWLHDLRDAARRSLQRTRQLLPVLRDAGVVDAGAKGFVGLLEGVVRLMDGKTVPSEENGEEPPLEVEEAEGLTRARESGAGAGEGRFCTQIAIRGERLPTAADVRGALAGKGTSTIVLRAGSVIKVHIHTDAPEAVRDLLAGMGEIVSERFEDTTDLPRRRDVAVVTDSSADLPQQWVEKHGVKVVPLLVVVREETYRDAVDLSAERLRELVGRSTGPHPTTSQPTPREFVERYGAALAGGGNELLGIFLSSVLSGTYASAVTGLRELPASVRWEAVDSRSTSLGLGLLVVRAVELLDGGMPMVEVAAELRRIRERSNLFFTVDTFDCLLRSGRVGRARAWLGGLLDIKPILSLDAQGRIEPRAIARGREALLPRVLGLLDDALRNAERYRLGVVHFAAPEMASRITGELRCRYQAVDVLSGPVTAALAVHLGPGAWGVAYQIED